MYNMLDCLLMLLFKIIYFFERRTRIINNTRNDFPIWHSAEHVGLYLLFKNLTKTEFKLDLFICYFFLLIIWLGSSFLIVNFYLKRNYLKRYPIWVKENDQLKVILVNKLKSNSEKWRFHNLVIKPWLLHMKMEFVTWESIGKISKALCLKVNPDEFDVVVGIQTGGSFVGYLISKELKKPFEIIDSKLWSGKSFRQNCIQSSSYFMGYDICPRIDNVPLLNDKRILLVDDTTYTGVTLTKVTNSLISTGKASSVKTMVMWTEGKYQPDYFFSTQRVPIMWEWGSEVD